MNATPPSDESPTRGETWRSIWIERDDDRADWNGLEACFESEAAYERWTHDLTAMLIEELALTPHDVVADLGCGTGRIAALIAPHVAQVLAFDYSSTVLDVGRRRRSAPNITFSNVDLNLLDPSTLAATKAYAIGALLYLDSEDTARQLMGGLAQRGIAFAAVDMPDEERTDDVARNYDRSVYSHVQFSVERLLGWFPSGRVIRHDRFPEYVHSGHRFTFVVD